MWEGLMKTASFIDVYREDKRERKAETENALSYWCPQNRLINEQMIGDIQTFLKLFDVHEISVTFLDTYVFEYCATLYET